MISCIFSTVQKASCWIGVIPFKMTLFPISYAKSLFSSVRFRAGGLPVFLAKTSVAPGFRSLSDPAVNPADLNASSLPQVKSVVFVIH
ncbi:hypothetical protein Trydic_g5854 [Trypoxylus dichotomus]